MYIRPELQRVVCSEDINLQIMKQTMVFKAMAKDEIMDGESGE